jgi:glycosyltransferase involved in cell wall biosynthesis
MQTLVYGLSSYRKKILGNMLRKTILKIYERHNDYNFYLYLASDIFNLSSLGEVSSTNFFVGYNVLLNFAPLPVVLDYTRLGDVFTTEFLKNVLLSAITEQIDLQAVKYIERILAHTKFQKELYVKFRGISESSVTIFPHLIDVDLVRRTALSSNYNERGWPIPKKDIFTVIYVGRLVKEKGIHILLEAFSLALRRGCSGRLIVLGRGPLRTLVMKYEKKLGNNLLWLGEKMYPEALKLKLISLSDALILPSLHEMFGFAILEALSLGKPVIVSRVGGIPEVVKPPCGSLVNPGDVEMLSDAILHICSNGYHNNIACSDQYVNNFNTEVRAKYFVEFIERYGELPKTMFLT